MQYIADPAEVSRILGTSLGEPVYKAIRMDEDGNQIVVPVFKIEQNGGVKVRKKLKDIIFSITGVVIITLIIWAVIILAIGLTANADGPGYNRIEDTEDQKVIEITEQVSRIYPICPELLQAMVFYESSNRMSAKNGSCIGYMQVSTKWHADRAKQLGVSIRDGYGNILTGTDYLFELCEKYGDVALALMVYHGESDAEEKAERGEISDYARKILNLSADLEQLHGK